jgi:hypothetical protein
MEGSHHFLAHSVDGQIFIARQVVKWYLVRPLDSLAKFKVFLTQRREVVSFLFVFLSCCHSSLENERCLSKLLSCPGCVEAIQGDSDGASLNQL